MQKRLFALIFAVALSVAISTVPAHGQYAPTIGVDVPFAFNAGGKDLPSGHYRIEPANDNRGLWRIRGDDNDARSFLLATTLAGNSDGDLLVTFHRYGERSYLAGFTTQAYEVTLPSSKNERALRKARGPMARVETIYIALPSSGTSVAANVEQENRK